MSTYLGRAYVLLAWLVIALACLHMATTWRLSSATAFTRVWFFAAGIAMAEAGLMNLLNRTYGRNAPGLRWSTRGVNLAMLAFSAVAGTLTGATAGEFIMVLGLLGGLTLLSFAVRG